MRSLCFVINQYGSEVIFLGLKTSERSELVQIALSEKTRGRRAFRIKSRDDYTFE